MRPIRDTLQPLAERICIELCRWPYTAPSQEVLDAICGGCEVMAELEKVMASRAGRPSVEAMESDGGAAKRKSSGPEPPKPEGKAARAAAPEGPPHSAAAEKRAVLERLTAYRQEHGRGSLRGLAKASGVRESVLWDMLERAVVPIEAWRAVGRALDELGVRG